MMNAGVRLHHAAMGRADSSDGVGIDPDGDWRSEALKSVARMKRSEIRDPSLRLPPHCASLHAGYEPSRIERRKIDSFRRAVDDQLRHRLAGRRRVQNAPHAVARRNVGAGNARHFSDQWQAILRDRPIAGLARQDFCSSEAPARALSRGFLAAPARLGRA